MVAVRSNYGAVAASAPAPVQRRRQFFVAALLASVAVVAIVALLVLTTNEDGMVSLAEPFKPPPPYLWTQAGDKAIADEITKSNKMWEFPEYKWGKKGETAAHKELVDYASAFKTHPDQ
eukprot:CAMPEP_0114548718 /NCGR_PEP_ID=MMETSP0114-20121206/5137_1 /TAXON_ID=31324 /ORGANISM="Goniomonas sp, Strain m" /LENGTH=118 /DNA_ID=CAMNT_0001733339 /DNA_START=9 /DNA_END=365 /DNA_ORIENTATION=-